MTTPPLILVIDDNVADVGLLEFAFESIAFPVRLAKVFDGVEAQRWLDAAAASGECPRLVLLDLNMPRSGGYDVLRYLQRTGRCAEARVVVLTTSDLEGDRVLCRELGARAVVTKPTRLDDLLALAESLKAQVLAPAEGWP